MTTKIEDFAPHDLSQLNLEPRGRVFPSPMLWKIMCFIKFCQTASVWREMPRIQALTVQ